MQTFLPHPLFIESARRLDRQRLGKQRVEVLQILRALAGRTKGWVNHPITKAWRGYEEALVEYGLAVCDEWIACGYRDTCRPKIAAFSHGGPAIRPPWMRPTLHQAYRRLLIAKNPATS